MCGFVCEVLNTIKEPFICTMDGVSKEYENGAVAIGELSAHLKVTHCIERICIHNGKLCVMIYDSQCEINERNKIWITVEKEKTGFEPSFF